MSLLSIVPTRLLAEIGAVVLLLFALWLENGWREDWKGQYQALQASERANAERNKGELHDAAQSKAAEVASTARAVAAGPHPVVRLCIRPPAVPASPAASPAASAASGDLQPVHGGDSGSGPGREGPDVGGLLRALALKADSVSADLREQQAVR